MDMNETQRDAKARLLRADIIKMLYHAQSGHPGGALSCVEILMALYYTAARVDPENPLWENRDRIVLSKGHACPALYAILADRGFFPREDLWTLRKLGSHLQGHPDHNKTPGIDAGTGSLGQGLSIAVGMAIAVSSKKNGAGVYAIVGDGELQEGIVWEAAMSAAHYKLSNLTVLLDCNGLQIDGPTDDVMSTGDIMAKFSAFGFSCHEADGHSVADMLRALESDSEGKPKFICCKTIKGKGVSFMEDVPSWHGKAPNFEEYRKAMKELGVAEDA